MQWTIRGLSLAALVCLVVPANAAEETATIAHIRLTGGLDESPGPEAPLFGAATENFQAKLDRIKKARNDERVKGLFLELDGLSVGFGKVDELCRAIADFRAAGKKVVAYTENAEQKDYLVAVACDHVAVPEAGWLMLTGLRSEVTFYKKLFDKIGVKANIMAMGDFKGAPEPYTRDSMSPESKQQLGTVLDDFFGESIVAHVAKARKLEPAKVREIIDAAPYTAKKAKELGLIDSVSYPAEFEKAFPKAFGVESVKVSRDYGKAIAKEMTFTEIMSLFAGGKPGKSILSSTKPKIAVVYVVGAISSGKSSSSPLMGDSVGSTTIVEAIKEADKDSTVKAIVLRVDSPGGSALASDLIWDALKNCKKPVIASMGDTAASGGYYVCMSARKIFAEPGTLTGSIGVFGGKLVTGGAFEKIDVHTETLTRGKNAGLFSTTTEFTDSEKAAMLELLKDTYGQFLDKAVAGRKKAGVELTREKLEKELAGGRIWTGRQAKGHGLVDELGTLGDAIAEAKKSAGIDPKTEMELLQLPKARGFLEQLIEDDLGVRAPAVGEQILADLPGVGEHLRGAGVLLKSRPDRVWLMAPYRLRIE